MTFHQKKNNRGCHGRTARLALVRRIDAHQHYWSLQRGDYGWLTAAKGALCRDYTPEELRGQLEECAVTATVLVQAAPTEDETRYLFALARETASVAGVVGWVAFEARDVAQRIGALVQDGDGKLKALRPMIQDIADPRWLARDSLDVAFDALIANNLAFDALVLPPHLPLLEQRLLHHPRLRAVLDHAGKPDIAGGAFEPWASALERLARNTSIYCKLSGLLTEAASGAGAAQLDRYVEHLFACFGSQRIMWGSDWPVLTARASYRQWLQIALELVQRHAPGHEDAVFATTAAHFYALDTRQVARPHTTRG
jgi:L-fuconolactonase